MLVLVRECLPLIMMPLRRIILQLKNVLLDIGQVGTFGFDLKLTEKFGFFLETNFKNTFGDEGIPHFNHSLGFSYGLGTLDSDQDGVPDKDDNCPDEAANTDSGCPLAESTIIDALNEAGINILFPADGSELRGTKVLDAVAQVKTILDENPRGIVLIQGHASDDGSVEYNQALSERRAESVKSKLIELGVDPARLEVQAFGESRPIVADDISVSRRKSRRVVFSAKQQSIGMIFKKAEYISAFFILSKQEQLIFSSLPT